MHIYAQIIDDSKGITLASASTQSLKLKSNSIENAQKVGAAVAKMAMDKGIKEVVFDRGGYIYHGKVKAIADSAREAGLKF
jgi:large subunit ribosomal protein L18